jgi:glycosyltransferase involved in cell wall biosynthesis
VKISVIIPTKDRQSILQRTIENLLKAVENIEAEIIIINDSSNSISLLHQDNRIKLINNNKAGAASARNLGVLHSTGTLLLFLDDDIIVNKVNILRTIELHIGRNKVGFNFFWLYPPDLIERLPQISLGRYFLKHLLFTNSFRIKIDNRVERLVKMDGLTSQYFSILKSDFQLTGGYDENIPYAGIEDLILYKLLREHGIEIYLSTADIVFQNESDRLSLNSIMERTRQGAITIKKAEVLGHNMDLSISFIKKGLYSFLINFKTIIFNLANLIPNKKYCDFIYFKLVNVLLGLSFYQGYYRDSKLH